MTEFQRKTNELLYNAWKAYRKCISHADWANTFESDNVLFKIYNWSSLADMKEAQTWLKAWSIMTDIEMEICELSKFNSEDFHIAQVC